MRHRGFLINFERQFKLFCRFLQFPLGGEYKPLAVINVLISLRVNLLQVRGKFNLPVKVN